MIGRTSLQKATALSAVLGLAATAAHAESIADVAKQNDELSTFSEAVAAAGVDLTGEGPFTVFAPSDQAFERLPQGALDELMKQENQAQLSKLVQHHVVEGEEIAAKDLLGKQTEVDTLSGDALTVDGTTQVVLLVPAGLTAARTPTDEESGMPVTEHQQEVLESEPEQEAQQTAPEGTDMPATEHQQEVLAEGGQQGQQEPPTAASTPTAEESGMPVTEHQQEVLESEPEQEPQQTAPGGTDMPATEHQRQALADDGSPDEQEQSEQARVQGAPEMLRQAAVVEPDIEAANGVIHVIDAVLVPQSVLEALQAAEGQG